MPSDPEVLEVHKDLLCLLKRFHEICVSNNIKYVLHGGTLIGAIREKGFIPWDNDVDIAMMRAEYNKLLAVAEKGAIDSDLIFDNVHRVPRLVMKKGGRETTFLDIFIYDPITTNKLGECIKIYGNMFFRAFVEDDFNFAAGKLRKKYSTWKYGLYGFFQKIGKLFPTKVPLAVFTFYNMHFLCGKKDHLFRSNDGFPGLWKGVAAEDMEHYILVPFEDTELLVPENYHEMLISFYGDYMTPVKYDDVELEAHDVMREMM